MKQAAKKVEIEKFVPLVARSAKYLAAEKKLQMFKDPVTGEVMTMDEAMNRSKEGGFKGPRK